MESARKIRHVCSRAMLALVSILVTSLAVGVAGSAPAQAQFSDPVEPPRPAFYEQPPTLPAANGAVIRAERMTYLLDPFDLTSLVRNSWRIMYRTTNRTGRPIAVSGTVMVPSTPWYGMGSRPVIGYAPGTQGLADRCAPSRQYSEGLEYEALGVEGLLARGYAVVMPDYEGLGTVGVHTYMDRVAQGRATLDAVRAAQRLTGTGLSTLSPVGLQGYSQGGGAAASAVELAPSYAPELRIKGAVVGAVPADLKAVAAQLDGSLYAMFGLFALRGLAASYDLDIAPYLNAKGQAELAGAEQACVFDLFQGSFVRAETLTVDGRTATQLFGQQPFSTMIAQQRIGAIKPAAPVLVTHSALDDVIPYGVGKTMARSWCGKGANVRFSTNYLPTHLGGFVPHSAEALRFWEARFASVPQLSNCWLL